MSSFSPSLFLEPGNLFDSAIQDTPAIFKLECPIFNDTELLLQPIAVRIQGSLFTVDLPDLLLNFPPRRRLNLNILLRGHDCFPFGPWYRY